MSDEYQIEIPASFVALYVLPGRQKPSLPRDEVAARYELCAADRRRHVGHAALLSPSAAPSWSKQDSSGRSENTPRPGG